MIYYTGDLHGSYDIHKLSSQNFKEQKELTKKDYLVIAGDFGLIWYHEAHKFFKEEDYWLNWLNNRNYTTLVVLGNHENYDIINSEKFKLVSMFGDVVKQVRDSVFILQTGHIYNIDGIKTFAFGGGMSIDKHRRTEHISWWREEIPSYSEMKMGIDNLTKINNNVDVIISHATHRKMFESLNLFDIGKETDPLIPYLTQVQENTNYKFWVNGHYHIDKMHIPSKTASLYQNIVSYDDLLRIFNG